MEKRFILFLVLAFLVITANALITSIFFPPQPRPVAQQPEARPAEKPAAKKERAQPVDDVVEPAAGDDEADAPGSDDAAPETKEPSAEAPTEEKFRSRRASLGSYDPASGYRMLVTLNSAGAAVERVELNSPKYLELEDRSGYLGHLAPADAPGGGVHLQVVGRGTPAALAGLQAGDLVRLVNGQETATAAEFEAALKRTEPGHEIEIAGTRDGEPLKVTARLSRRPLEVIRPEWKSKPLDVVGKEHDPFSLLLTLEQVGKRRLTNEQDELRGVDLREGNWELVTAKESEVLFRRRLPKLGIEITKRYRLAAAQPGDENADAPEYHLLFDLDIRNTGDKQQSVAYRLEGPTGLPLEGSWYATKISRNWGASGMRDVVARFTNKPTTQVSCPEIADDKATNWSESDVPLDFLAVDTQYFAAALLPLKSQPNEFWFERLTPIRVGAVPDDKSDKRLTDVSFRLSSKAFELDPQGTLHHEYQLFAGPKKPAILDQYVNQDANLGELVYYGWFGWVAKPMLGILHTLYMVVRNYGIAIILLTVLVRGCMFPLSRKQALSAQKMQELRPEIQRINEKYKKPEERTRAMQEMYRKHNYNPFAGCLPMFIQLPIFIGLYRSLMVDVELRGAPLISEAVRWCSNLAAPDMFWHWADVVPNFVVSYLGPYLNLLPLATIGLFIWQQKMFMPPPTDEQSAMQQKMMSYMMIFMGFLFFKVASGLCLYFIASSLWGIAERKALPQNKSGQGGNGAAKAALPGGNGAASGKKRQAGRK